MYLLRNTSKWGKSILLICITREGKPYREDKGDGGSTSLFMPQDTTTNRTHRAEGANTVNAYGIVKLIQNGG